MYWAAPTPEELDKVPWYTAADYPEPKVEVWDENWDVIALFTQYATQWRFAMNGPVGLDFNVFHHALDRKGVLDEEFDTYIEKLRIIEAQALAHINR